jgi:hypothetical protein
MLRHLVPPEAVLVELREAVDHDGDGQGENEDTGEGAETTDNLACRFSDRVIGLKLVLAATKKGARIEVVSHRSNRHQAPPGDRVLLPVPCAVGG